jgi:hypothetical protein
VLYIVGIGASLDAAERNFVPARIEFQLPSESAPRNLNYEQQEWRKLSSILDEFLKLCDK